MPPKAASKADVDAYAAVRARGLANAQPPFGHTIIPALRVANPDPQYSSENDVDVYEAVRARGHTIIPALQVNPDPQYSSEEESDSDESGDTAREYVNASLRAIAAEDADSTREWLYAKAFHRGGQGVVSLWVKVTEDNLVDDHMVVKRLPRDGYQLHQLARPGLVKHVPKEMLDHEVLMQHLEKNDIEHPNLIGLIYWDVRDDVAYPFYMYLEYAPFGSLWDLMTAYKRKREYLPELFVWYVFHALAHACYTLQTGRSGRVPEHRRKEVEWGGYVHLDIKLSNVFLKASEEEERDRDRIDNYCTPVLGDFGVMESKRRMKRKINTAGTSVYKAPEQVEDEVVTTDVWGIAMTIWSLTRLKDGNRYSYGVFGSVPPAEPPGYQGFYSQKLETLIYECLQRDSQERPEVEDLIQGTRDGLSEYRRRVCGDGVGASNRVPRWEEVRFPDEEFPRNKPFKRRKLDGDE